MLLLVAVLSFLLMQLLPGDPAVVIAGADATPEAVDRLRAQLGLDRPVLEQLLHLGRSAAARQLRLLARAQPERAVGGRRTPAGDAVAGVPGVLHHAAGRHAARRLSRHAFAARASTRW